jgi:hypothetical protein
MKIHKRKIRRRGTASPKKIEKAKWPFLRKTRRSAPCCSFFFFFFSLSLAGKGQVAPPLSEGGAQVAPHTSFIYIYIF